MNNEESFMVNIILVFKYSIFHFSIISQKTEMLLAIFKKNNVSKNCLQ